MKNRKKNLVMITRKVNIKVRVLNEHVQQQQQYLYFLHKYTYV